MSPTRLTLIRLLITALSTALLGQGPALAGDRTLVQEITIEAPVADVWRAFTFEEEVVTWMCELAEIDLSVGGLFRTNYNPDGEIGDATTIINEIISFEPERMLSMRNVGVPEGFAWEEKFQQTWSVVYFEPLTPTRTHVRIVGLGYGEGGDWDTLYQYFEQGNSYLLGLLKKKLEAGDDGDDEIVTDPNMILERLSFMVGGEWIHESESPSGGLFRVRNVIEKGADGVSLVRAACAIPFPMSCWCRGTEAMTCGFQWRCGGGCWRRWSVGSRSPPSPADSRSANAGCTS